MIFFGKGSIRSTIYPFRFTARKFSERTASKDRLTLQIMPSVPLGLLSESLTSVSLRRVSHKLTRWSLNSSIISFVENFVAPFIVWQVYYDAHQKLPSWGECSHFAEGIAEYYAELLGINRRQAFVDFTKPLARKNRF